jgi:hypothetical protein
MLDAETLENTDGTIVHAHGNAEVVFAHGPAKYFAYLRIQLQQFGYMVKLSLSHFERVGSSCHCSSPLEV